MRAMFHDFPDDAVCWDLVDQYMYGPDLLVAPVLHAGTTSREVHLPAGASWVHLPSGGRHQGGGTVTVEAPLESIPLFAREGADVAGLLMNGHSQQA